MMLATYMLKRMFVQMAHVFIVVTLSRSADVLLQLKTLHRQPRME